MKKLLSAHHCGWWSGRVTLPAKRSYVIWAYMERWKDNSYIAMFQNVTFHADLHSPAAYFIAGLSDLYGQVQTIGGAWKNSKLYMNTVVGTYITSLRLDLLW